MFGLTTVQTYVSVQLHLCTSALTLKYFLEIQKLEEFRHFSLRSH